MHHLHLDCLKIRPSEFGKGLFTTKPIEAGTKILKIFGNEINFASTIELQQNESHAFQFDFDKYILLEPPFLFANHSCDPNCGVNSNMELIALKKIKKGEELFWDYSTSMLERHWTMECSCGEKNCRKMINDFDLLPQEIQIKYLRLNIVLPYIVNFLQQQLAKSA